MTDLAKKAFSALIKSSTVVDENDIKALRKAKERFYIIKYQDKLYMNKNISSVKPYLDGHLCGACRHCLALPTEEGGCDKVWDNKHSHIYKYPFIRLGLESFNCSTNANDPDFFWVSFCKHFKKDPPRENTGIPTGFNYSRTDKFEKFPSMTTFFFPSSPFK